VVTLLFTDIESSTVLWDNEPSAMSDAIRLHDALLRAAVEAHDGRVFASAGDGFGAAFPRVEAALGAALEAQRGLAGAVWPTSLPLRVRMGIHSGPAEERGGDYLGPTVNRAARVMSLARGRQILVSAASQDALVASDLTLVDGGEHRLKGFAEPERIFAVAAPGLDGDPPSSLSRRVRPPRALTRLIGRDRELGAIAAAMEESPLVTLTGVGGVGKTRLALAVAERISRSFSEGEFWIDLTLVGEQADATAAIAAILGIKPRPDAPGIPKVEQIAEAVSDRQVLIALDNCEHVASAVRAVVTTLLERCPRVGVLATSRERLGVPGERIVAVEPLAADDQDSSAVVLLTERIDGQGAGEPVEASVLVEIARRVDGLPLALELAAARCRSLGPGAVLSRLHELTVLSDPSRPDERHRTLEAVLEWSFNLLSKRDRRVLEAVSVFAGAFTLEAAEQVAGGDVAPAEVDEAMASLVDKSLVERRGDHFRLLETTRQFSTRQLEGSGFQSSVGQAYCRFVVQRAQVIHAGLRSGDEAEWVLTLDAEWPDVRAVVRRALDEDDADTAIALVTLYAFEAFWRRPEAFAWISEAADRYRDRPGPHRHELLGAAAMVAWTRVDVPRSIALAEAALAADAAPGTALDCLPQAGAAGAYSYTGRMDEAVEVMSLGLAAPGPMTDLWGAAQLATSLALVRSLTRADAMAGAAARAVELTSLTRNPSLIAYAAAVRASTLAADQPQKAIAQLEDAGRLAEQVHNGWLDGLILGDLAAARLAAGLLDEALAGFLEIADRTHATGWTIHAWSQLWSAVTTLYHLGHLEEAALLFGGCLASTTPPFTNQAPPSELETITGNNGNQHLAALRAVGANLGVPELVRIARGEQDLPSI
jgi:predicted ATPase/class 3 adenylate cyclase